MNSAQPADLSRLGQPMSRPHYRHTGGTGPTKYWPSTPLTTIVRQFEFDAIYPIFMALEFGRRADR